MEINMNHPITKKMEELYNNKDFDTLDNIVDEFAKNTWPYKSE